MNPSTSKSMKPKTQSKCNLYLKPLCPQATLWQFIQKQLHPAPPHNEPINVPPTDTPMTQDTTAMPLPQIQQPTEPYPDTTAHQLSLLHETTNPEWGECDQYYQPHDFLWIISKNVSTLNPQSLDMMAIPEELHNVNASVFVAQETNMAWKLATLLSMTMQCHCVQRHHKLAVSSSQDGNGATYQPGSTLTLALGKWASCIIGKWTR